MSSLSYVKASLALHHLHRRDLLPGKTISAIGIPVVLIVAAAGMWGWCRRHPEVSCCGRRHGGEHAYDPEAVDGYSFDDVHMQQWQGAGQQPGMESYGPQYTQEVYEQEYAEKVHEQPYAPQAWDGSHMPAVPPPSYSGMVYR